MEIVTQIFMFLCLLVVYIVVKSAAGYNDGK